MKTSSEGIELIKQFEGLRLKAYKDTAGIRTIGYGHAYWKGPDTITKEEAEELLKSDLIKFEEAVMKYDNIYHWKQSSFDAMVSFAFNVGTIKTLTADGTRSINEIADKMLLYVNSGGKRIEGLYQRRLKERDLFLRDSIIKPVVTANIPNYIIGKVYTTSVNLMIRTAASIDASVVRYVDLSADAKKHLVNGQPILSKGTKVTCKSKVVDNKGNVWLKIPSGYICAYEIGKDKVYVS